MFIFSRLFVDVNIFDLLTFILELFQDRKNDRGSFHGKQLERREGGGGYFNHNT